MTDAEELLAMEAEYRRVTGDDEGYADLVFGMMTYGESPMNDDDRYLKRLDAIIALATGLRDSQIVDPTSEVSQHDQARLRELSQQLDVDMDNRWIKSEP
jgi:hypothetical protein